MATFALGVCRSLEKHFFLFILLCLFLVPFCYFLSCSTLCLISHSFDRFSSPLSQLYIKKSLIVSLSHRHSKSTRSFDRQSTCYDAETPRPPSSTIRLCTAIGRILFVLACFFFVLFAMATLGHAGHCRSCPRCRPHIFDLRVFTHCHHTFYTI